MPIPHGFPTKSSSAIVGWYEVSYSNSLGLTRLLMHLWYLVYGTIAEYFISTLLDIRNLSALKALYWTASIAENRLICDWRKILFPLASFKKRASVFAVSIMASQFCPATFWYPNVRNRICHPVFHISVHPWYVASVKSLLKFSVPFAPLNFWIIAFHYSSHYWC